MSLLPVSVVRRGWSSKEEVEFGIAALPLTRGLHSSTDQLNVSAIVGCVRCIMLWNTSGGVRDKSNVSEPKPKT